MTLTATWLILDASGHSEKTMTIRDNDDVDALIAALSEPATTDASIHHEDRSPVEFDGEQVDDHALNAGIHGGLGYLTHGDPDHEPAFSVGASDSAEYPGYFVEYPAGSGVPVDAFLEALAEFLLTAKRPANLEWRTIE